MPTAYSAGGALRLSHENEHVVKSCASSKRGGFTTQETWIYLAVPEIAGCTIEPGGVEEILVPKPVFCSPAG